MVGSINADLSVATEHLPQPGQTVRSGGLVIGSGGKSANQAVAASRLGASVSMVGAVGRDEHGGILRGALEREGINTSRVQSFSDVATGTALITYATRVLSGPGRAKQPVQSTRSISGLSVIAELPSSGGGACHPDQRATSSTTRDRA